MTKTKKTMPDPIQVPDAVELTQDQKTAIQNARGPVWKKVLFWALGVLGILLILVVVIAVVVASRGKKRPVDTAKAVVNFAKAQNVRADAEARVEVARAAGAEQAVLDELDRIKEIEDEYERSKRLAEMF